MMAKAYLWHQLGKLPNGQPPYCHSSTTRKNFIYTNLAIYKHLTSAKLRKFQQIDQWKNSKNAPKFRHSKKWSDFGTGLSTAWATYRASVGNGYINNR